MEIEFSAASALLPARGSGDRVAAKRWLVICSCGWERETSSAWAANSVRKLHPPIASTDGEHVTRVEGPDEGVGGKQLTLT